MRRGTGAKSREPGARRLAAAKRAELVAKKQPPEGATWEAIPADRGAYLRQLSTAFRKAFGEDVPLPEHPLPAEAKPDQVGVMMELTLR